MGNEREGKRLSDGGGSHAESQRQTEDFKKLLTTQSTDQSEHVPELREHADTYYNLEQMRYNEGNRNEVDEYRNTDTRKQTDRYIQT